MPNFIDITGRRFGLLTVLEIAPEPRQRHIRWVCTCDCGRTFTAKGYHLRSGGTQSCGCRGSEKRRIRCTKHADTGSSEYRIWLGIKDRCYRTSSKAYKNYGARGIVVDERWLSDYGAFLSDMGRRPSRMHSIERLDNDGNYAPGNCVWATRSEQNNNTRTNRHVVVFGERLTVAQAALKYGVQFGTLLARLKRGLDPETAVTVARYGRVRHVS